MIKKKIKYKNNKVKKVVVLKTMIPTEEIIQGLRKEIII